MHIKDKHTHTHTHTHNWQFNPTRFEQKGERTRAHKETQARKTQSEYTFTDVSTKSHRLNSAKLRIQKHVVGVVRTLHIMIDSMFLLLLHTIISAFGMPIARDPIDACGESLLVRCKKAQQSQTCNLRIGIVQLIDPCPFLAKHSGWASRGRSTHCPCKQGL